MKVKKKKNKKNSLVILGIVVIVLLAVAIVVFAFNASKNKKNDTEYYQPESRYEKAAATIIEGTVTKGWIKVQGTNVDYPVVEEHEIISGVKEYAWISSEYYDGENRMAIYGHNMQNVSYKPLIADPEHKRFEQLLSFVYEDFAKENLYIQYSHDDVDELYKIYAIGFYDFEDDYGYSYDYNMQAESLTNYINDVKTSSIYNYNVDVNNTDELLSLITCTRFFGNSELTTFKIDARKVRDGEKIEKYSVQKSTNYDILGLE